MPPARRLQPLASFDLETGEVAPDLCPGCQERDDKIEGLKNSLSAQLGEKTKLQRQLAHMQGVEPDSDGVREALEYWRDKTNSNAKIVPGSPRWKKAKERLSERDVEGKAVFVVADLKLAVDGALLSKFHVENGHLKAETIFRDQGTVEAHRDRALGYQAELAPILKLPVTLRQADLELLAKTCECGHQRIEHSVMRWEGAGPMLGWEPCMGQDCSCTDFEEAA